MDDSIFQQAEQSLMLTDWVMVVSILAVPWLLLYPRVGAIVFDAGNVLLFFGIATVLLAVGLFLVPPGRDTEWLRAVLCTPFYQLVLHRVLYSWFLHRHERPPEEVRDVSKRGLGPDRIYGFFYLVLAIIPPLLAFT